MMLLNQTLAVLAGALLFFGSFLIHAVSALSISSPPSNSNINDAAFSLSHYQKARALETVQSLDASRLHFQILFVDTDNSKGRITEGLVARVAEHNDAMFVIFPASATIIESTSSHHPSPRDAAAPEAAVALCESLGLCSTRSTMLGTSFDLSYLDEYDLVVAMDDDIRSMILRSLSVTDQEYYGPKCRLLSEFLSPEFCSISSSKSNNAEQQNEGTNDQTNIQHDVLLNMLDPELRDHVAPFSDLIIDRSSNVITQPDSQTALTAALILASSGLVRFCLDTIDAHFETAFQTLLQHNFYSQEHLVEFHNGSKSNNSNWYQADDQLRRCSASVTGFFSPEQRRRRFDRHIADLSIKLAASCNG
jgi:hypothetical protein